MNSRKKWLVGLGLVLTLGALMARADDDDDEGEREGSRRAQRRTVAAPADPAYKAECGSCHMVYPPGLLPARSWTKMMAGLKDHFGENATLDAKTTSQIRDYLTANAADRAGQRRSQKIARSIPSDETPLRITDTLFFKRQHHEVSARVWRRPAVGSPSRCSVCHARAEQGAFSEDEVRIPK